MKNVTCIMLMKFLLNSTFSKIDENIADGPHGVNRQAPQPVDTWQPFDLLPASTGGTGRAGKHGTS